MYRGGGWVDVVKGWDRVELGEEKKGVRMMGLGDCYYITLLFLFWHHIAQC